MALLIFKRNFSDHNGVVDTVCSDCRRLGECVRENSKLNFQENFMIDENAMREIERLNKLYKERWRIRTT